MSARLLLLASLLLAGCPADPPPPPRASLRLVSVGPRRDEVVACVVSLTGYARPLAERLVDRAPVTLPSLPSGAREGKAALEALGAEALVLQSEQRER